MASEPTKNTIQAWIHLHRSHRLLLEKVEKALKTEGLPPLDWYDVLLELHKAKPAGLRQYEIGDKILLNKHNLSRLIDRLETKQLLGRHACTEDGRGNLIKITNKGEKLLNEVWPVYSQSIQQNFGVALSREESIELSRILGKALEHRELH